MSNSAPPPSRSTSNSPHGDASWQTLLRPAPHDSAPLRTACLTGKRVLITGAGGSIGSALALAVRASSPSALILLDTSESGLYQVDRTLRDAGSTQHIPILGSICDQSTLEHLFEQHTPQIIIHAAALKHVPLMEQNPFAAVTNNALGTLMLTQTATRHRAERLILVSTDKAVDPHSIMGASKRIAELILLTHTSSSTRLVAVRLCNVIGSQGSVLPLLLDQLAHNVPLTVTHPEASRYFITLHRAVESIFAALETNASPTLFIPSPGPPLRILDLAEHLLRTHTSTSRITFTGLRPGDKLSEHLTSSRERILPGTESNTVLRVIESAEPTPSLLESTLNDLREAARAHDLSSLLRAIHTVVPEYEPSSILAGTPEIEPAAEAHA
jgi:FlaA1/EpsC-like NDP-sugar epimerase